MVPVWWVDMVAHAFGLRSNARREDRYLVDLAGTAIFEDGAASVRVRDISLGGARIEFPMHAHLYQPEALLSLRIAGTLDLRAQWRWSRDRQVGLAFTSQDLAKAGITRLIARVMPE